MRRLQQHLRSAFFTAGSTTELDFVCDPHKDPIVMEVSRWFMRAHAAQRLLLCCARGAAPHAAGVAREALLRMPLAVATKRAAQAHETWGYATPPSSCAGRRARGQEGALLEAMKREH